MTIESFSSTTTSSIGVSTDLSSDESSSVSSETDTDDITVTYSDDGTTTTDDGSDSTDGTDGADSNGLTFPSFDIDMRDTMLALASLQSENAEDQIEFSTEQVESLVSDKFDSATNNVKKAVKARKAAKKAGFWADVAEKGGIGATIAMGIVATVTLNPVLMTATIAMGVVTAMNSSGATQDLIDATGGGAQGTVITGCIIGAACIASGGVAALAAGPAMALSVGITAFTTMAPSMICSAENLQELGVAENDAVWASVVITASTAIVGAVAVAGIAKAAATATEAGAEASQGAVAAAESSASAAQSTTAQMAEQTSAMASKLKSVMSSVANSRFANLLKGSATGLPEKIAEKAALFTKISVRANQVGLAGEAILGSVTTGAEIATAEFSQDASILTAQADKATAQSQFLSTNQNLYEDLLSSAGDSFNTQLGTVVDCLSGMKSATTLILQG